MLRVGNFAVRASRARLPRARAYHQEVIDHFEKPLNVGSLDKKDPTVGTGLVGAPACGDVMKLQIKVDDDGNVVDAKFKTFGCGSARFPAPGERARARARNVPGSRSGSGGRGRQGAVGGGERFTGFVRDACLCQTASPPRRARARRRTRPRPPQAIASSSVASEWVKGRNIHGDDALITNAEIAAHLKLPPVKLHCSMLAEDAINAAIADYKAKQKKVADEAA